MGRSALGLIAVAGFVAGPGLAWLRLVPALAGFAVFALSGLLAAAVGVASLVQAARGRGLTAGGGLALLVAAALVTVAARGAGLPRINDFTTDPADPPAFHAAAGLPANAGRDMTYPAAFAAQQRRCCPDLAPVELPAGVDAFARARRAAESMPAWTVIDADRAAGRIEAVATTRLFGFHDDVVIRVRPLPDGRSRVDVRSKSRDGKGDLGTNAARIRAYVAALAAG
ncbi:MAG TPA: DUF1499 domain-containing protein [Candidatus Binatia bacterium]|nr:DUF1499 domain-containing protein [Candidatus Binatia bacterium]